MKTSELRDLLKKSPKHKGVKIIKPYNLVNSGFPSCFNLSFGEGLMHESFGQYLDYNRDLIFSTIQPCIRHEDWKIIVEKGSNNFKYLSLFDMADVGGMAILLKENDREGVVKFHMKSEIDFLKKVGLDICKLKILYFRETPIAEATKGKYNIDKNFPTDPMYKYWLELGIKSEQLVFDKTRDTMLALNIFGLPTPWGYRYEILYEYNEDLWDIGTVEYLAYRPILDKEKNIKDIIPFNHFVCVSVIGLERVVAIVNNKKKVWEVDIIYPLIELLKNKASIKNEDNLVVTIQAFRTIHKIISDGNLYKDLNKRRKEYIRGFYREFFQRLKGLEIEYNSDLVKRLAKLNSDLNPWYPELNSEIENVLSEFELRYKSFRDDKSVKYKKNVKKLHFK